MLVRRESPPVWGQRVQVVGNSYNLANSILYDHIYMTTQHGLKSHSGINTRPCMTVRMLGQVLTHKRAKISNFFRRIPPKK